MQIEEINTQEDYEDFKLYLAENPKLNVTSINNPYINLDKFRFKISKKFPKAFDDIVNYIQGLPPEKVIKLNKIDDTEECLFGKDKRKRITNADVKNDELHLFYADGKVEIIPCVYWVLAEKNLDGKFELLDGDCEYKYVKSFTKEEDLKSFKKRFYQSLYTIADLTEQQLCYYGITVHKDLSFNELRVLSFDIESTGTQHDKNAQVLLISNTYWDGTTLTRSLYNIDDYKNAGEMLIAWCNDIAEYNPAVITGHNIIGFDLPYMNFIAKREKVILSLGRDRSAMTINTRASNYRVDGSQVWEFKNIKIFGREIVDGMFLAVKYDIGRNFPSWGLKPIIEYLGLVADGRQFYDASLIGKNWSIPEEKAKIIEYCKFDGDDSLELYKLMGASLFYAARSIPKSFQTIVNTATGGWLNSIMTRSYIQNEHSIPKANDYTPVTGGISFGVPGIHKNVFKIDIASLYPSIMRNYKINDPKKDPNNVFFKLVDFNTKARLEYKKKGNETGDKYYKDLDASSKVFINSAYGLLGTGKVNYNNFKNADFITSVGRRILSLTMVWATGGDVNYWFHPEYTLDGEYKNAEHDKQYEQYLDLKEFTPHNFVIVNADTDSISIKKEDESEFTEQERKDLLEEINGLLPELLNYEDDGYFVKLCVNKAKNYILYDGKKIKLKGSSFKDAKKEPVMKEMMNKIISEYLIHETRDYVEIYEEYIQEVYNMKDIKRWAGKKNITEKVMKNDRTTEAKVREALDEMDEDFVIGDKVFLYSAIDGEVPDLDKDSNPKIYKRTGLVKMIPKRVLKHIDLFNGDHDVDHYLKRVYDTINIFSNIIDMSRIKKYKGIE